MSGMTRVSELVDLQVIERLARSRIIALAELRNAEQAELTATSLASGGVGCMELVNPTVATLRAARQVDGLLVGAGNVHSLDQVAAAVRGGAHFATAPATNMEVVYTCRELELPFFPGAATPTEIERLALLGIHAVRLFPIEPLGGAAYLQAIAATYPDLRLLPSGGIGPESVRRYLQLPSVLAVASGGLVPADLLRARNYDRIEWLARDVQRAYA
jgi:2-dehydro-3-deoxyphosphogluconate aldolase/(4S)-4-hydroxy-2-oxoglutarate aldolase